MRQFLYFLTDDQGRFYYSDNGAVSMSTQPRPLTYTPDQWLDIEIERQRNINYFALDRTFTIPLDFVKDGATIVKHLFYTQGIEGQMYLSIAEQRLYIEPDTYLTDDQGNILYDGDTPLILEEDAMYGFYYSLLYKGELDFSQFEHVGAKVSLTIMEGGTSKLFRANINTRYDIDFRDYVLVQSDGINLRDTINWVMQGDTISTVNNQHVPGAIYTTREIEKGGVAPFTALSTVSPGSADESTAYFFSVERDIPGMRIIGNIPLEFATNAENPGDVTLNLFTNTLRTIPLTTFEATDGSKTLTFDVTFDAFKGEKFFLFMVGNPLDAYDYSEDGTIQLKYTSRKEPSQFLAVRPLVLLQKLAAKMGITEVRSTVLEKYKDIVVTCGDAIRQLSGPEGFFTPRIKTSFSDFFQSYTSVLGLAVGIENGVLIVEDKKYFVNYEAAIDLGAVKDAKVGPAKEYIYNTIKIGYPNQNFEDVNGRDEFNVTHVYTTPVTRLTKELNLVSVYRADSYGIEFTRINFDGKTTTDSSSDNDVFMVHIGNVIQKPFGFPEAFWYYNLERSLNAFAENLPDPSVFNLFLSPKQNLFRNGNFIRSCFYTMDGRYIRFQSSDKASLVIVRQPNKPVIDEDGDVLIGSLGERLFTPMNIEFEAKTPYDILDILKKKPYTSFKFNVNGVNFLGFPQKDKVKPGTNEAQTYTVLSSHLNNLALMEDYYGE